MALRDLWGHSRAAAVAIAVLWICVLAAPYGWHTADRADAACNQWLGLYMWNSHHRSGGLPGATAESTAACPEGWYFMGSAKREFCSEALFELQPQACHSWHKVRRASRAMLLLGALAAALLLLGAAFARFTEVAESCFVLAFLFGIAGLAVYFFVTRDLDAIGFTGAAQQTFGRVFFLALAVGLASALPYMLSRTSKEKARATERRANGAGYGAARV